MDVNVFEKQCPGWKVDRRIGVGSFGTVYEISRDLFGTKEYAALKHIRIPPKDDELDELFASGYDEVSISAHYESCLADIIREYALMSRMKGHPNIVYCDDVKYIPREDSYGWDIFIKMELLTPLLKYMGKNAEEAKIIKLGMDICMALIQCKELNIVHRDIKPQNIFVSRSGEFKLGDFGIAKTIERTRSGTKMGTINYMAPEVHNNQPYGTSVDIYSLGMVMYWMLNECKLPFLPLTAAVPTVSEQENALYRRFNGEPIPDPKNGSEDLKRIVLKACAFDPKERYHSAADMLADLNAIGEKQVHIVIPPTPAPVPESELVVPATVPDPELEPIEPTPVPDVDKGAEEERTVAGKVEKKKRGKVALLGGLAAALALVVGIWISGAGDKSPDEQGKAVQKLAVETTLPAETLPIQVELSEWTDTLPDYVTSTDYVIEEQTLYSTQKLEKTTSTESDKLEGWTLVDTISNIGEYSPWSEWSEGKMEATDTRNVEIQTHYRYKTKETTMSSSSGKDGWELYDTSYSVVNCGPWSAWSETSISESNSRQVEQKIQYRYADRITTASTESTLSGWTQYDSEIIWGEWGEWSEWTMDTVDNTEGRQIESRKSYLYSIWECSNCGFEGPFSICFAEYGGCGGDYYEIPHLVRIPDPGNVSVWDSRNTGPGTIYEIYHQGKYWYYNSHYDHPDVEYRYRDREQLDIRYHYWKWGDWSSWSDNVYKESETTNVETRLMYRYRECEKIPTYHFYRWGNWSDWSTKAVSENSNRKVETKTYYRYQDKITETTYCFERWSDWSAYTTEVASESEEQKVQTKKQYRYRSKTADEKRNPYIDVDKKES